MSEKDHLSYAGLSVNISSSSHPFHRLSIHPHGTRRLHSLRHTYLYPISHESDLSMKKDWMSWTSTRHSSDLLQVRPVVWMMMTYWAGWSILGQWASLASQADRCTISGQAAVGQKHACARSGHPPYYGTSRPPSRHPALTVTADLENRAAPGGPPENRNCLPRCRSQESPVTTPKIRTRRTLGMLDLRGHGCFIPAAKCTYLSEQLSVCVCVCVCVCNRVFLEKSIEFSSENVSLRITCGPQNSVSVSSY